MKYYYGTERILFINLVIKYRVFLFQIESLKNLLADLVSATKVLYFGKFSLFNFLVLKKNLVMFFFSNTDYMYKIFIFAGLNHVQKINYKYIPLIYRKYDYVFVLQKRYCFHHITFVYLHVFFLYFLSYTMRPPTKTSTVSHAKRD